MLAFVVAVVGVYAQQTVPEYQQLGLGDAVSIALSNNYDIRIERGNVEIARNNNNLGQAGLFPTVTLNINQNNNLTDNIQTASPFALQGLTVAQSVVPSVNVNWVLFDGFRVWINKQRLEQMQAQSEGNASIVIANSLQMVILGYFLTTLEEERLKAFQKQLVLSRDKFEYARIGAELGTVGSTEIFLEEGNYLADSIAVINQRLAFRNAIRNLNLIMGVEDLDRSYDLTDRIEMDFPEYSREALSDKMLSNNVDLSKQYITQAILGSNTDLARADRLPTLALNAGAVGNRGWNDLSRTSLGDQQRAARSSNPDTTFDVSALQSLSSLSTNFFANLTLSFTLFKGGKINRAIQNALVQEDIGSIRLDRLKSSLTRDLQRALDTYNVRKSIYEINLRREEVAQSNLDLSQDQFRGGTINSFDYRVVQNTYLSASTQRLQSVYNLIESKVELMRLTGGLVAEYVPE